MTRARSLNLAVTVAVVSLSVAAARPLAQATAPVDLLIRGGRILDGTGNPWFRGDLAITGGRIVAVGHLPQVTATRTIDARDRIVAPGFIDVHSHAAE
jgi:N-acyl-D-aspartate/D-glutamate deacylase